jgi:hypothetical protein
MRHAMWNKKIEVMEIFISVEGETRRENNK